MSRESLSWWSSGQLRAAWIYRREFHSDDHSGANPAAPFRLWRLEGGRAEVEYSSHRWSISGGEWLALPPGFSSQRIAKGSQLVSVALDWQDADGRRPLDDLPPLSFDGSSQWAEIFTALQKWARSHSHAEYSDWLLNRSRITPQAYGELQALLWSLLAQVLSLYEKSGNAPLAAPQDKRVRQVLGALQASAAGPFPDKKELEAKCGLSWRRIEQLCAAHLKISPGAYHARLRLREAQRLLLEGDLQVKQIAFQLGFPNDSIFCQWFKQNIGSTPAQFTRSIRV